MEAETIAIVMGVVEALKRAGVTGRASFIVAVLLAFVIFGGQQAAATWTSLQPVFQVVLYGLYGVAATGWYDLVSATLPKVSAPAGREVR